MRPLVSMIRFMSIALTILATGCAAPSPAPAAPESRPQAVAKKTYSKSEKSLLTYCVGFTDTAWNIASRKIAGAKREEVAAYYAKQPNTELTSAAIEKVYGDAFTHSWDYSVEFFRECAVNIAHVSHEASGLGAYCMQNAMLSGLAQEYRAAGDSKERAYAKLPLQGDTPRALVDTVYKTNKPRAETMMGAWDSCMAPITSEK